MFDIAFSEMLVVALVALIVIGPEKLPKVARTLGLLAGRLQRYVADVKADVERELRVQELGQLEADGRRQVAALETAMRDELQPKQDPVPAVEPPGDPAEGDAGRPASGAP